MRAAQLRLRLFNVSVAKGAPQCANPYRAIDNAQPTKVWYLSFRLAEFDPETYGPTFTLHGGEASMSLIRNGKRPAWMVWAIRNQLSKVDRNGCSERTMSRVSEVSAWLNILYSNYLGRRHSFPRSYIPSRKEPLGFEYIKSHLKSLFISGSLALLSTGN